MAGTFINVAAILLGGGLGLLAGSRLTVKFRDTLVAGLGLFTLAYGVFIFTKTQNMLIPLLSLVMGTVLGEALKLEDHLNALGLRIQQAVYRKSESSSAESSRFITGFVTASLLFVIGPMAILGSIQDGLSGDFEMLAIKSVLDGLAAMAFASTLGIGVLFSVLIVLVYQGAFSLAARLAGQGFDPGAVTEMTAVGGVILVGIALSNLLGIKQIRTGSFLPALLFAILIVTLLNRLGIAY